jgi:desulfoferrodoxin-like iron-binding protein
MYRSSVSGEAMSANDTKGQIQMNESPILGGVHRVENVDVADDFSKKHVPYVSTKREGDHVTIAVEVGHYVAHPNMPDHWIDMIEICANDAPIMTCHFAAGVVTPRVATTAQLDPGTHIAVFERCNLHGLWATETTV